MRLVLAAAVSLVPLAGCPTPVPPAIVDANPADAGDAGLCPEEIFFTGAYVDWDSSDADFHGIVGATFEVDGTVDPAHMAVTAPNGRARLCIPASGRTSLTITPAAGDDHLVGRFIADPLVFGAGNSFQARGLTPTRATSFFGAEALTYDDTKAQLFVQQVGTPVSLALSGATAQQTFSSPDGLTWTSGQTADVFAFFANVTVTGAPQLTGATTGGGEVPMNPGQMTYTTVEP